MTPSRFLQPSQEAEILWPGGGHRGLSMVRTRYTAEHTFHGLREAPQRGAIVIVLSSDVPDRCGKVTPLSVVAVGRTSGMTHF